MDVPFPDVSTASDSPRVLETPGNASVDDAAARAMAAAEGGRKTRRDKGYPRGSRNPESSAYRTGDALSPPSKMSPELRRAIEEQLEHCYDPKAWASLLTLPAAGALAITGNAHWKVTAEEKDTLGSVGSVAARFMMLSNPKMLAFLMLGSGLFAVYVPRILQEFTIRSQAKKSEEVK